MSTFSSDEMRALTQAVVRHLDDWDITSEQMLVLLGLEGDLRPRHLQQYRQGDKVFAASPALLERIDHIVGIADALRTTFPFSNQMRLLWLRKPHRRFSQRSPLTVMLEEGTDGLMKVRIEVDCAYGYAINDALQAQSRQAKQTAA